MSENPELILTFNWDGTVEKETKNFKGKSCVQETKFIEEALGKAGERRLKKEFYDNRVKYQQGNQEKQGNSY